MNIRNWHTKKPPKEAQYNPRPLKPQPIDLNEWNNRVLRGNGVDINDKVCQFCKGTGLLKERNKKGENLHCHHCKNNTQKDGKLKFSFS